MNRNEFNRFIAGGALPGPGDLEGLRELTSLFPWFHSAHMVLLRGLKENADVRFDAQLKASALSVSDREVLYHYLFMHPAAEVKQEEVVEEAVAREEVAHEEPVPEETPEEEVIQEEVTQPEPLHEEPLHEEAVVEEAVVEEVVTEEVVQETAVQEVAPTPVVEESSERTREDLMAEIEARLEELASPPEEELSPAPEEVPELENVVPPEAEASAATVKEEQEPESEDLLELMTDNEPAEPEPVKQLSPQDLIDRFIRSSPTLERIPLPETQPMMDMSESGTDEAGTFITETLAKIYINQGYYSRAINIYEKLSLQFPEKSAYFAGRIEKIKDLIK